MLFRNRTLCILGAALALPAFADFSYQETTRVTGGSLTRMMKFVPGGGKALEPQTSYLYLKGNKLANAGKDSINIIDLDAETITDINLEKKTYSVITFQEMAQALEAARQKMEAELRKQNKGQQSDVSMSFSVKVNETGQRKRISGYDTREFEMLMEMQASSAQGQTPATGNMEFDINMWMAPDIDGYNQIRDFYMRMAQKMAWNPKMSNFAGLMNMQPGMSQGMAEMMKEMQKLEGVPVLQVTSIKGAALGEMPSISGPSGQDVNDAVADEARRTASNEAARSVSRSTGGRFGGLAGRAASGALGGLGRRKQEEPKPEPEAKPEAAQAKAGVLMEMTSESSNFSTAPVDASKFGIPSDFRQVEHEMKKLLK